MTDVNQGPSSVPSLAETPSFKADPAATDREALSIVEGPDATVAVGRKTADPLAGAAPALPTAPPAEAAPDATTALGPDSPARRTGGHDIAPNPRPSGKSFPLGMLLGLGTVGLVLGGLAIAWFAGAFHRDPVQEPKPTIPASAEVEVPPALRTYLRDAQNGDAKAMRMLGVMYYNGLNCPQNREEGRKWFTKAAEAGSDAARKDLEQLGLPVPPKKH